MKKSFINATKARRTDQQVYDWQMEETMARDRVQLKRKSADFHSGNRVTK